MPYAPKRKRKERLFELSDESRPRLSNDPIPLKHKDFPENDLEFQVSFLEGILRQDPHHKEAIVFLGHAYTQLGRYAEGLEMDKRIVRMCPDDPVALYNLACSYSLLNETDKALDALETAASKGYCDVEHMLQDEDLANVRDHPRLADIVSRMTRK